MTIILYKKVFSFVWLQTSITRLSRSEENRHPCLVPNLRRILVLQYDANYTFFIHAIYQVKKVPFGFLFAKSFIRNGYWILSSDFPVC